jgi:UDP-N-acetylmuramate--alanine ligase
MTQAVDFSGRPFHFIGIGGIGMSALAQIVAEKKLPISGSDLKQSPITSRLQSLGAHVFLGQRAENLCHFQPSGQAPGYEAVAVKGGTATLTQAATEVKLQDLDQDYLPQVVCSTAIHADNAEYSAAQSLGCPIFHRSDILAALIETCPKSIAVAGTHGKTTTSGMIGYLLTQAGLDPTIVIGGEVKALGGNARLGKSEFLVAEADESDGSLVKFSPHVGVITNMELDHPDHYADLEAVVSTFRQFAQRCDFVVGCLDCENVRDRLDLDISYSLHRESGADYAVDQISYAGSGTTAWVWERGERLGELSVALLGAHNLSNALAAVAVGRHCGLTFSVIAQAIATYEGARRRFEYRGHAQDIVFVEDYAHHPSELTATLGAARLQIQTESTRLPVLPQRIVAIFQPHRYSRTQALMEDFAECFEDADEVIICDVYSAGEKDPGGLAGGQQLAEAIARQHSHVSYGGSLESVGDRLRQSLKPHDLALFLGAGNLNQVIPDLVAYFDTSR